MALPHSDAFFIKAYPAETTEALCDGHVAAFAFFGGVPLSILFDNTTLAVAKRPPEGALSGRLLFTAHSVVGSCRRAGDAGMAVMPAVRDGLGRLCSIF